MATKDNKTEAQQIVDLLRHWLKYWYVFIISFGVCGVIGAAYYVTRTPVKQVKGSVALRKDSGLSGSVALSQASSLMSSFGLGSKSGANIEDETIKLSSQSHVRQMVKNLGLNTVYDETKFLGLKKVPLYERSPIVLKTDPALADTMTRAIKFSIKLENGDKAKITLKMGRKKIGVYNVQSFPFTCNTAWGEYVFDKSEYFNDYEKPMQIIGMFSSYDYMAQIYKNQLEIDYAKKTSDIIYLDIKGENTVLCKNILYDLIDVYNKVYEEDRNIVTDKTIAFIEERLVETEGALANADYKIQQFKDKNNLTEIEADVTYYFTVAGEVQKLLLEAETQLSIANLMSDFLNDPRNKYALIPYSITTSDTGISEAITMYNELLAKRNEMNKGGSLSALSKSMDEQIEMQRLNMVKSLENIIDGLKVSVRTLKRREAEFNAKLGNLPSVEKDLLTLRREQEIQQTMYIFLLQMKEETGVKGVNLLSRLQIVDSPYVVNKPVSPNIMKIGMIIIFLGGILIPLSIIYLIPLLGSLRKKE